MKKQNSSFDGNRPKKIERTNVNSKKSTGGSPPDFAAKKPYTGIKKRVETEDKKITPTFHQRVTNFERTSRDLFKAWKDIGNSSAIKKNLHQETGFTFKKINSLYNEASQAASDYTNISNKKSLEAKKELKNFIEKSATISEYLKTLQRLQSEINGSTEILPMLSQAVSPELNSNIASSSDTTITTPQDIYSIQQDSSPQYGASKLLENNTLLDNSKQRKIFQDQAKVFEETFTKINKIWNNLGKSPEGLALREQHLSQDQFMSLYQEVNKASKDFIDKYNNESKGLKTAIELEELEESEYLNKLLSDYTAKQDKVLDILKTLQQLPMPSQDTPSRQFDGAQSPSDILFEKKLSTNDNKRIADLFKENIKTFHL